jgi:hypothetical protein
MAKQHSTVEKLSSAVAGTTQRMPPSPSCLSESIFPHGHGCAPCAVSLAAFMAHELR